MHALPAPILFAPRPTNEPSQLVALILEASLSPPPLLHLRLGQPQALDDPGQLVAALLPASNDALLQAR